MSNAITSIKTKENFNTSMVSTLQSVQFVDVACHTYTNYTIMQNFNKMLEAFPSLRTQNKVISVCKNIDHKTSNITSMFAISDSA